MEIEFNTDLDNININTLKKYLHIIKMLGKQRIVKLAYRQSSGKKGFHIKVIMQMPDCFKEQITDFDSFLLGLRYGYLDCYGRLKGDMARIFLKENADRLASYKDGNYSGEWIEYDTELTN